MGSIMYGTPPAAIEVDDRTLAHLQIVIINKFRRDERFLLTLNASPNAGTGRRGVWMHPTIPLQFDFKGSRQPTINPEWIEALMERANSGAGLRIVPEPVGATAVPLRRAEPAA
ncbi:ATP-dependent DNA ligase [Rathayibacter festucae]|uniref:ATP-dependent DNA ligase n=1 Tax=Rathayibacter festucae TaxID=110937 RepID=A0ABX6GWD3_9MICO|nr:ATP-dependent DNA ligase [Rathayibacter festucae]QHC61834.1 ATP-dependent DNA ligase [Rathayibacter festucae]